MSTRVRICQTQLHVCGVWTSTVHTEYTDYRVHTNYIYYSPGSTSGTDQVFLPSSSSRPASIAGTKAPGSPRNGTPCTPSSPGPTTDKFYPAHRGSGGAGDKWNPKRASTGPDMWDTTHRGSAPPDLPSQRREKRSTSEGTGKVRVLILCYLAQVPTVNFRAGWEDKFVLDSQKFGHNRESLSISQLIISIT